MISDDGALHVLFLLTSLDSCHDQQVRCLDLMFGKWPFHREVNMESDFRNGGWGSDGDVYKHRFVHDDYTLQDTNQI